MTNPEHARCESRPDGGAPRRASPTRALPLNEMWRLMTAMERLAVLNELRVCLCADPGVKTYLEAVRHEHLVKLDTHGEWVLRRRRQPKSAF